MRLCPVLSKLFPLVAMKVAANGAVRRAVEEVGKCGEG